jgi:hypothetical protein
MEKNENVPQEGEFKMKKKRGRPKKLVNSETATARIDLSKKEETEIKEETNANTESSAVDVPVEESTPRVQEVEVSEPEVQQTEEKVEEKVEDTKPVIEEIEKTKEPIAEKEPEVNKLPENIEKLVSFMEETGGDISDYVRLNADYSNVDEDALLKEYYKNTKPHLNEEEVNFIMEEQFKVDEDYDEERDQRRKKLAKKEEVAKAKTHLESLKQKYYEEIKLRPTVNNELTKANEFFNRYTQEQEVAKKRHEAFKQDTNNYLNEEFKGFEFSLGEKNFRYAVNSGRDVAEAQSDISNVIKKFLNEKGEVIDIKGYHKAMYAARNADNIAKHFYEQGKADAVKDVVAKSKNISTEARSSAPEDIYLKGFKLKAVSGVDSSKLKIKRKNKN